MRVTGAEKRGWAFAYRLALERMLMIHPIGLAVAAHVKVITLSAPETIPGLDLHIAHVARPGKRRSCRIVEMVQNHHGGMARSANCVELIVVALAQ